MFLAKPLALLVGLHLATAAPAAAPAQPWESSSLSLETGLLWEVGRSTSFPYRFLTSQLSWRSAEFLGHEFADGSRLVVRHRLTGLGTLIARGPESHYFAIAGSPSVEWWDPTGTWSLFSGAGGGLGVIDSRGIPGGQGQDLTLNWFLRGGLEGGAAGGVRWSAGLLYQHLSNGGMTTPNPGINALGFSLGGAWKF